MNFIVQGAATLIRVVVRVRPSGLKAKVGAGSIFDKSWKMNNLAPQQATTATKGQQQQQQQQ